MVARKLTPVKIYLSHNGDSNLWAKVLQQEFWPRFPLVITSLSFFHSAFLATMHFPVLIWLPILVFIVFVSQAEPEQCSQISFI